MGRETLERCHFAVSARGRGGAADGLDPQLRELAPNGGDGCLGMSVGVAHPDKDFEFRIPLDSVRAEEFSKFRSGACGRFQNRDAGACTRRERLGSLAPAKASNREQRQQVIDAWRGHQSAN